MTQAASAGTIVEFFRLTNNASQDIASQISVEVLDESEAEAAFPIDVPAGNVLFAIRNNVGAASSISEVYFDDGTIIGAPTIFNDLGGDTDFKGGANPSNLPSGSNLSPPFVATQLFSVDAQGNPSKGVDNSADILGLAFELAAGKAFDDLITSLHTGELRIGMHVRAIGPESDSFVNIPPPNTEGIIPEPSSAVLLLGGLLAAHRRRR